MTERKGIGTGWFYSVLGGGLSKDPNTGAIANLRPTNNVERVPMYFDNTAQRRMRGDFAIPALFGGNFDAVFNPRYDPTNITTIDKIEELTGLDILSNLPDEIENNLRADSMMFQ